MTDTLDAKLVFTPRKPRRPFAWPQGLSLLVLAAAVLASSLLLLGMMCI